MATRRRPPKMRSLAIVIAALRNYIPSSEPHYEHRCSERGVPNLRYQAETNGISWTVDLYMGHFYRVRIGNQTGEVFRTIPTLIGYLLRSLQIMR